RTALSDIDREQRKAESDVDQVRSRADRDRARLDAGQVSSPKELEGLQSEIASLQRRQAELEEVVLEVMERREAAEAEAASVTAELERAEAGREAAEERRSAAALEIEDERATERDRRERLAKEVPQDLLALYTKLRDQYGIGAAALHYGRCEGCKLALSTAELGRIRQAPADEVLRCEDCRRIVVPTSEWGRWGRGSAGWGAGWRWGPTGGRGGPGGRRGWARWGAMRPAGRCWPRWRSRSGRPPTTWRSTG